MAKLRFLSTNSSNKGLKRLNFPFLHRENIISSYLDSEVNLLGFNGLNFSIIESRSTKSLVDSFSSMIDQPLKEMNKCFLGTL